MAAPRALHGYNNSFGCSLWHTLRSTLKFIDQYILEIKHSNIMFANKSCLVSKKYGLGRGLIVFP